MSVCVLSEITEKGLAFIGKINLNPKFLASNETVEFLNKPVFIQFW